MARWRSRSTRPRSGRPGLWSSISGRPPGRSSCRVPDTRPKLPSSGMRASSLWSPVATCSSSPTPLIASATSRFAGWRNAPRPQPIVSASKDPHPLVVGKSLAASFAAREALPAIWLTPLIAARGTSAASEVLTGLRAGSQPRLLVGGTADSTWDGNLAASLRATTVLDIPDADHSLELKGDLAGSLENLSMVAQAMLRFMLAVAGDLEPGD